VGFFRRGQNDQAREREEPLARIEAGGIPAAAETRLKALAADGSLFTSGLSVKEFALLDRMGPRPLAQVMGASVVRVGWQYLPALSPGQSYMSLYASQEATPFRDRTPAAYRIPTIYGRAVQNPFTAPSFAQVRNYRWYTEVVCELDVFRDAWNMARRRALDRLTEEALQVRADAVVGVHLRRGDHDLAEGTIEYVVSGTAIRLANSTGERLPVLTDLSVQDYWRLVRAGHEPTGLLATTAVVFASPPRSTRMRRLRTTARNQELEEISSAFRSARETVRARLRRQIADAHGTVAVGVEFAHSVHRERLAVASSLSGGMQPGWHRGQFFSVPYLVSGRSDVKRRGWVITMHAAGTAIRRRQGPSEEPIKTTMRMEAR
jgi:uncharacterized protein YbjQ (UPF0145 family)